MEPTTAIIGGLAGLVIGGLVAWLAASRSWAGKLATTEQHAASLEQAKQSAKKDNGELRKQLEMLQGEVNELRAQAMRAKARSDAAAVPSDMRHEAEDLLLRAAPPASSDNFPATMIQPRKPQQPPAEEPFPATMIQPRKPG